MKKIWFIDSLTREVSASQPEPKKCWFYNDDDRVYLSLGKTSVTDPGGIQFDNGRHRTRWMLDQKVIEIPVLLTHYSYFVALTTGVLSRRAFVGDVIPGLK